MSIGGLSRYLDKHRYPAERKSDISMNGASMGHRAARRRLMFLTRKGAMQVISDKNEEVEQKNYMDIGVVRIYNPQKLKDVRVDEYDRASVLAYEVYTERSESGETGLIVVKGIGRYEDLGYPHMNFFSSVEEAEQHCRQRIKQVLREDFDFGMDMGW